jgi:hypothetical protein
VLLDCPRGHCLVLLDCPRGQGELSEMFRDCDLLDLLWRKLQ